MSARPIEPQPVEPRSFFETTPIFRRRAARDAFCRNAFLWGVGNSFVNSTFVIYFLKALVPNASDSAALGTAIAWTVAAPRLIGALRLLTPWAIGVIGGRKRLCVGAATFSPLILLALPLGAPLFERLATTATSLNLAFFLVGAIWALHHLVEYVATAALWSWMGDALSPASRLRFFARRERRLLLGKLVGLALVGVFTYLESSQTFALELLSSNAWRIALPSLGVVFLTASAVPLFRAPEICVENARKTSFTAMLRQIAAPLRSRPFLSLVLFGCSIQAILGLTQAPQYYFRATTLQLSLFTSLTATAIVNFGQWSAASRAARFVARRGVPTACFLALGVASLGFLLYAATPANAWALIFVASIFWIAWVVVNIALNNEITKRSEPCERSSFVAFYFTATTLSFGVSTMLGGRLFDRFRDVVWSIPGLDLELDYCRLIFILGAALLASSPTFLFCRREPPNTRAPND
ncbi:MAG: hypothetical protein IKU86_07295 [Thermoguttaceae bacterium]|nr:hypothetical protein [Thermoguttaceae bacterium]